MKNNVLVTIKKELRGIVRDKKSLLMMIVAPIMIPTFIFLLSFLYDTLLSDEEKPNYEVGFNYVLNEDEKNIVKDLKINITSYESEEELQDAFNNGKIAAYLVLQDGKYTIYANDMTENGSGAAGQIGVYLDNYNTFLGQQYLVNNGVDVEKVYNNIQYQFEEIKTGSNDFVKEIISMGFIFSIMAITLSAVYCATDSTAGEKERGTLETFLTFPIKSSELITGKYLAITLACFVTSIISVILEVVSLSLASGMFEIYKDIVFKFNIGTMSLVLLIMFSYSLFISGLCIAIASFAKTYKEAQSALTPITFLVMIPMFFDMLGYKLNSVISIIPVVSHSLLINDIFFNSLNVPYLLLMFASTIVYVVVLIMYITKQYKSEKILFSI